MATTPDSAPAPVVGIVIAAHQAEQWVAETLATVAAQTRGDFACVVVDDGSRDATADVVRRSVAGDDRFTLLQRPNGGVSAARNTGLAALPASCRYVVFLDSDDLWLPDALEVLVDHLERRPGAAGVTATAELVDEEGTPIEDGLHSAKLRERVVAQGGRLRRLPDGSDTTFAALATAGRVWPPAVALLRRDVVDAVGGFDESLVISEDWDLFLRVSRSGPLSFLDRQVAWYRRRAGSATADDPGRVVYFNDVVRRKAWADPSNTPEQRRAALASWRTVQLHAAALAAREVLPAVRRRSRSQARRATSTTLTLLGGALRSAPPLPQRDLGDLRAPMIAVVQPHPRRRPAH